MDFIRSIEQCLYLGKHNHCFGSGGAARLDRPVGDFTVIQDRSILKFDSWNQSGHLLSVRQNKGSEEATCSRLQLGGLSWRHVRSFLGPIILDPYFGIGELRVVMQWTRGWVTGSFGSRGWLQWKVVVKARLDMSRFLWKLKHII